MIKTRLNEKSAEVLKEGARDVKKVDVVNYSDSDCLVAHTQMLTRRY